MLLNFNTRDITIPKEGFFVYKDKYWVCVDGDPAKAVFFGDNPQCNRYDRIVEHGIKTKLYGDMNVSAVFVETAFVPL